MSKEYLINEAHQLDHQTTILNKLDCVRIRCREEEEAERETHKKKIKTIFDSHSNWMSAPASSSPHFSV